MPELTNNKTYHFLKELLGTSTLFVFAKQKGSLRCLTFSPLCGAYGSRTRDLQIANLALCQLS